MEISEIRRIHLGGENMKYLSKAHSKGQVKPFLFHVIALDTRYDNIEMMHTNEIKRRLHKGDREGLVA